LQTALSAAQIDVLREQAADLWSADGADGRRRDGCAASGDRVLRSAVAYAAKVYAMGTHQLYDLASWRRCRSLDWRPRTRHC
jgi:hypothetical protein